MSMESTVLAREFGLRAEDVEGIFASTETPGQVASRLGIAVSVAEEIVKYRKTKTRK